MYTSAIRNIFITFKRLKAEYIATKASSISNKHSMILYKFYLLYFF